MIGFSLVDALSDAAFVYQLPDLVVDLNMPEYDGREVIRQITAAKEFKNLPLILFSGSSNKMDAFYLSFSKTPRYNKQVCNTAYKKTVKEIVDNHLASTRNPMLNTYFPGSKDFG